MSTTIDPAQIGGQCRFYEKEFPELEECVMVNVKSIAEMGAYVQVSTAEKKEGLRVAFFFFLTYAANEERRCF